MRDRRASHTPIRARGATLLWSALASASLLPHAACSGGERPVSGGLLGGASGANPPTLAPCEPGTRTSCKVDLPQNDGVVSCIQGQRECQPSGVYGPCEEVPSAPSSAAATWRPAALSGAASCPDNVCDPDCKEYDEDPPDPIQPDPVGDGGGGGGSEPTIEDADYLDRLLDDIDHGPDYGNCSSTGNCQLDHYCDETVCGGPNNQCGLCTAMTETQVTEGCESASDPDLTLQAIGTGDVAVCNHSPADAPAGARIGVFTGAKQDILDRIGEKTGLVSKIKACCNTGMGFDGTASCGGMGAQASAELYSWGSGDGTCFMQDPNYGCCSPRYAEVDTDDDGHYFLAGPLQLTAICEAPAVPAQTCVQAPDCYPYVNDFPLLVVVNPIDLKEYDGTEALAECTEDNNQSMPFNAAGGGDEGSACGEVVISGGAIASLPGGFESSLLKEPCSGPEDCQGDHRCDGGTCVPHADGETNAACAAQSAKYDLTLGIACDGYLPVCNRGTETAPSGVTVTVMNGNSAQLQNNFGTCSDFDGTVDSSCTTTESIPPGECVNAEGCLPLDIGTRGVVVNGQDFAGSIDECDCSNNWSTFNGASLGACPTAPSGEASTTDYAQAYTATCESWQRPQWQFLTYASTTTGNQQLEVLVHTADDVGSFAPADLCADCVSVAAIPSTHPTDCSLAGPDPCPVNLFDALGSNAKDSALEVIFRFTGDPDAACANPILNGWKVTYTCVDSL